MASVEKRIQELTFLVAQSGWLRTHPLAEQAITRASAASSSGLGPEFVTSADLAGIRDDDRKLHCLQAIEPPHQKRRPLLPSRSATVASLAVARPTCRSLLIVRGTPAGVARKAGDIQIIL